MPNMGNLFRDTVTDYINGWNENLEVLQEVNVGSRFVGTPRKLDIVIRNKDNNKTMAIECKVQLTSGSAYEKFSYALDDWLASPIPRQLHPLLDFSPPKRQGSEILSKLLTQYKKGSRF